MTDATLRIGFAGPHVSFQDAGRRGHKRFGVPASGPMDRLSHAAANAALGNAVGTTCLEISMGGLMVECSTGALSIAVAGGKFALDHAGAKSGGWRVLTLQPGDRLTIRPGAWGSWAYLAVAGDIVAPRWLGHTATHSISGFGGGAITTGQQIRVTNAERREDREGDIAQPGFVPPRGQARVVMGPQDQHFRPQAVQDFQTSRFQLSDAYDRMGVRLNGPRLGLKDVLSIPSEPILRGSLQVAGDGVTTVLLADHQTSGGYPKIATVIAPDLDQMTQLRARDDIRFEAITPDQAVTIARQYAQQRATYLHSIAIPRGSLLQRLMRENLVSGVISVDDTAQG